MVSRNHPISPAAATPPQVRPGWRPLPPAARRWGQHRAPTRLRTRRFLAAVNVLALGLGVVWVTGPVHTAEPPPVALPATRLVASVDASIPPETLPTSTVSGDAVASSLPDPTLPPVLDRPQPPPTTAPAPPAAPPSVAGEPSAPPVTLPLLFSPGKTDQPGDATDDGAARTIDDCRRAARQLPLTVDGSYDRNLLARMIQTLFSCVLQVEGYDERPPVSSRGWDATAWGFPSLVEQVAAEAVVVAYCESEGFHPRAIGGDNPWGYGGLFQMGWTEMRRFGPRQGDKLDPVDNVTAAATYFIWINRRGGGWGGWSPWAVVNTNFNDEVNDRVKVPVLPRFASTDPDYRGRRVQDLPAWAVDPWSWEVPAWNGCPFRGGGWPASRAWEPPPPPPPTTLPPRLAEELP